MAVNRIQIGEFLQSSKGNLLLDVRSPSEYAHGHIPGAISFPLFTDEERKIVGTAYKQESREKAIRIGLDFFGPRMRSMVEKAESLINDKRVIYIYCWRGGMRSGAVAWLLDLYGFRLFTLAGGYKAFRNHALREFEKPWPLRIIGGYTGSGKTEIINDLQANNKPIIDLERLASHKGSAFGSLGMPPQPTQEMFENYLFTHLEKNAETFSINDTNPIFIEDESQRIGNLNIPGAFWKQMRSAPIDFFEIPFDERLDHLVEEYSSADDEKLIESISRIRNRLGGLDASNAIAFIVAKEYTEAFRILLRYYDKFYLKGLNNRNNLETLLHKIPADKVDPQNSRFLSSNIKI